MQALATLVVFGSLLTSCAHPEPSIAFTQIPPYAEGSSDSSTSSAGRASNVRPGQSIVLYAKSGAWWVQPFATHPFTAVQGNSTWSNRTHPGNAYAALLVAAGYHPSLKTDILPEKGGPVLAVATAESAGWTRPAGKTVLFGGYEWQVREIQGDPGGSKNLYSRENAWTDRMGWLHLQIAGRPDHWTSAEVSIPRSLGYGTYRYVVRDLSQLEASAVFTMMIADESGPYREMDIEISKWGNDSARNGQFVIQPNQIPAKTNQYQAPAGTATYILRWTAGRAAFKVFHGAIANWESAAVREHVFTSGVPSPGNEAVHFNMYVFGPTSNPLRRGNEVIVEAFDYLP